MTSLVHLIKNYILFILWIIYFTSYFFFKESIFLYIDTNFSSFKSIFSYFNALIWVIMVLSFFWIIERYIKKITESFSSFFPTKKLQNYFTDFLWRLVNLLKISLSALAFFTLAPKDNIFENIEAKIIVILLTILIVYFLSGALRVILEKQFQKYNKSHSANRSIIKFLNKVIIIVIWIGWLAHILWALGYNISALIAWAWIGWLALALGAQKSLTNIFWAITIIFNKPFNIGDYVNVGGKEGVVKDIGLTYLTLADRAWHQVMIPNELIISSNIDNYSVRDNRREDFSIGVVYGTSLEKMKEAVKLVEKVLQKYEKKWGISEGTRVNFDTFGDFSLNINATYFSIVPDLLDHLKQKEIINLEIKKEFEKAWIEMAFPTQELIVKNENN